MALQYQWGQAGVTLVIPGAYVQTQVQPSSSALPSNGVLILVGRSFRWS
jgi:hypothetical protein